MSQYPRRTGNDFRGGITESLNAPGLDVTPPDGGNLAIADQIAGVFRDFRGTIAAGASLASDIAQSDLATARQQELERRQALKDQAQYDKDTLEALDKARDISMGQGRQLAAEVLPEVEAMVAVGQIPPPVDAKNIVAWAKEQAASLADANGLSADQRSGFIEDAVSRLAAVGRSKVVQVVGDARGQLIKDASRQAYAVAEDNPGDLPAMVSRVAKATGLPENEVKGGLLRDVMFDHAKAGRIKAVNAIAGVLGDEYRSDIDLANTVYDAWQTTQAAKESSDARRQLYRMIDEGASTPNVKSFMDNMFDNKTFDENDKMWGTNVLEQRDRRLAEETYRRAAESQIQSSVAEAADAFTIGMGADLPETVIATGPNSTKTIAPKERQRMGFEQNAAVIDSDPNIKNKLASKMALARDNGYVYEPWVDSWKSAYATIGTLSLSEKNPERPLTQARLATALDVFAEAEANYPTLKDNLQPEKARIFFENALKARQELNLPAGTSPLDINIAAIQQAAAMAKNQPKVNLERLNERIDAEVNSVARPWWGFNVKNPADIRADMEQQVIMRSSGGNERDALDLAVKTIERQQQRINGFYVRVPRPVNTGAAYDFQAGVEVVIDGIVTDHANRNLSLEGVPLDPDRVKPTYDPDTDTWALIDTEGMRGPIRLSDDQREVAVFTTDQLLARIRSYSEADILARSRFRRGTGMPNTPDLTPQQERLLNTPAPFGSQDFR